LAEEVAPTLTAPKPEHELVDGKRQDGSRQDRVPIVVEEDPSAFNLRAELETGDETMPLQASAGGPRGQNVQAQPVILERRLATGEEETEAMTSKWAKGTGGPAGDEEQNLVVEQTPAEEIAATLSSGSHPNSNAPARRKEDDRNLVVVPLDLRQVARGELDTNERPGGSSGGPPGTGVGEPGDPSFTLTERGQAVAYDVQPASSTKQQANALDAKETEVAGALTESGVNRRSDRGTIIVEGVGGDEAHTLTNEGHDASEDGTGRGTPIVFESRIARNGRGAPEDVAPPLKAQSGRTGKGDSAPMVAYAKKQRAHHAEDDESWAEADEAPTLDAAGHGPRTATAVVKMSQTGATGSNVFEDETPGLDQATRQLAVEAPTLRGYGHGAQGQHNDDAASMGLVRRLTPVECERLQSLPDGWTDVGDTADSRRYAALGDAVTANVSYWIGRRLLEREDELR
jgi:site-specific DNA-cytosine methylase